MKLLLDTHILLWAAGHPERLTETARCLLMTSENRLFFSAANIWEVVVKLGLGRQDFKIDPYRLRKMLVIHRYIELPVTAEHALRAGTLPPLHKDPFDRILIAQALSEGMRLVTADGTVARYGEPVLAV